MTSISKNGVPQATDLLCEITDTEYIFALKADDGGGEFFPYDNLPKSFYSVLSIGDGEVTLSDGTTKYTLYLSDKSNVSIFY